MAGGWGGGWDEGLDEEEEEQQGGKVCDQLVSSIAMYHVYTWVRII